MHTMTDGMWSQPEVEPGSGANMSLDEIKALLIEAPDDQALDAAARELAGRTPEEIRSSPVLSWMFLLNRIRTGRIQPQELEKTKDLVEVIDDRMRETLVRVSLGTENNVAGVLLLSFLKALGRISIKLAEALGRWADDKGINRNFRDFIEEQICLKCHDHETVRRVARYERHYEPDPGAVEFDILPRRLLPEHDAVDDPFMKLVPEDAPSKKDGLAILLISDFNIAGQLTGLMRALNKYTNHRARCVILQDDYLSYDRDVVITDGSGSVSESALAEAGELVEQADFFHVGRRLFSIPGVDWNRYVGPRNSVFQYFGSHLRENGKSVAEFHRKTGIKAVTNSDWTNYRNMPEGFYHLQPYLIEMEGMLEARMDTTGPVRICHSPSNKNYKVRKRSDLIVQVMNQVAEEIADVEPVFIEGVPNRECMEIKSTCHIHVVALRYGLGLNTIESAAMGLVPLVQIPNFVRFLIPGCPIVNVTADTLYRTVKSLLNDRIRLKEVGLECREWVRQQYDARRIVESYWYLYDFIYHSFSVDYPEVM